MNDPTGNDKQPDSGVDIFNMKPDANTASDLGKTQGDAVKPKAAAMPSLASKLGPRHFVIAGAVIAAAWIGWPYVFGRSAPEKSPTARMLNPDQAMSDASRAQQQYQPIPNRPSTAPAASTVATTAAPTVDASAALVAVASGPIAASATAAQTSQPTAKETELQAKVGDLQGKLDAAEAQAVKCSAPVATASTNVGKPKHRVRHVSTSPRRDVSTTSPTRIGAGTTKPGDFTLNTVYRDQAWIQNAERTYVVQAGDAIDGMRIVRVDASARQVVTSLGTIR
ncbi:hypothetical protein [Burkholderia cenocepacia]|uniref:hypothetical protein n=1 Tax=Burkholderia cenocepacia TaxID=95486 RepID=UPI002AB66897|nr:hypothetical protein [Burkholderia cenocepacia]